MHNKVAEIVVSLLMTIRCVTIIKRGIVGPHNKELTYEASDVLLGCIVLFVIFLQYW